jgi:diadenylate cyclase
MEEKKDILESVTKKEVQEKIIPLNNKKILEKTKEEEFLNVLKAIAPGTNLRSALDGALKAGKGALIVVENEGLLPILDGGFRVNCKFTPQKLVELTKMDGAIILSNDIKRINYANVTLTPDGHIKTNETGTRHKAAERTAKQVGTLVIAISEKKHEIHLFYKNIRYLVRNTEELLRKASSYIQMLEKQRELFDAYVAKLNKLELKNYTSLSQAINVLQKGKLIQKISEDLKKYIVELGSEGPILKVRMKELLTGVEKETNLVIKDYTALDFKKSKSLLDDLLYDEIIDPANIMRVLAYENLTTNLPVKGWRILSKTSLSEADIAKLIKGKGSLGATIHSNAQSYFEILDQQKAQIFKEEIDKIKMGL